MLVSLRLVTLPARASDVGEGVTLHGAALSGSFYPGARFLSRSQPSRNDLVFETAESDPVLQPFDTVLFQGILPDNGIRFEVSRKETGGVWSSWRSATVKQFQGGRFWAKGVFPDAAAGSIRLRALSPWFPPTQAVELYSVDVFVRGAAAPVEPPGSVRRFPGGLRPDGEALKPPVHGREEWGAKPPKEAFTEHAPEAMTQHHTAGRYTDILRDSTQEILFIQDFHQNGRGWNDIGYHFLIDGAGNIFQGRPEIVVGAHVLSHNTGNVGIAFLGRYHPPENRSISAAQRRALQTLGTWLRDRYGILPDTYKGHRDYNSKTDCPGDRVYSELGSIRDSLRKNLLTAHQ